MWNYKNYINWLKARLIETKDSLDFKAYNLEVYAEQDYTKNRSIKENTISVVVKFLSAGLIFNAKTQPIQMLVLSEENSIDVANTIMTSFCDTYNFTTSADGTTYTRHNYTSPVVLSNFNLIGVGLRTVLYISTTLIILEDVLDLNNLQVDGASLEYVTATIGYTMTGDTQPLGDGTSKTEKNFSTFVLTLVVPCTANNFTTKCFKIANNTSSLYGNDAFAFTFDIGEGANKVSFSYSLKLTNLSFTSALNNTPNLVLGFIL